MYIFYYNDLISSISMNFAISAIQSAPKDLQRLSKRLSSLIRRSIQIISLFPFYFIRIYSFFLSYTIENYQGRTFYKNCKPGRRWQPCFGIVCYILLHYTPTLWKMLIASLSNSNVSQQELKRLSKPFSLCAHSQLHQCFSLSRHWISSLLQSTAYIHIYNIIPFVTYYIYVCCLQTH